jgi:beta-phosphoglucomutase-like phosphatase (HAD superfamily)
MQKTQAYIFDLDGTLYDFERFTATILSFIPKKSIYTDPKK